MKHVKETDKKVTVVVWQYGRSAAPKIQTAEPIK